MFKTEIENARAQIKPKVVFNAKGLAEQVIITLEGALILAKAKNDISMVEKVCSTSRNISTAFSRNDTTKLHKS